MKRRTEVLTIGGLFSGIGGLEMGLEMTGGFKTAWQVEINAYAGRVLKKHWPDVPLYLDVREVGGHNLEPVDLICGGFPCQPHSLAGARKAEEDERDLWDEFARIVCELRPRWVLAENVPGLLSSRLGGRRGGFFGKVLADLAEIGYDTEWDCIPASALGAHHQRDRVFLVAYPNGERGGAPWADRAQTGQPVSPVGCHETLADTLGDRWEPGWDDHTEHDRTESGASREDAELGDAESIGRRARRAGRSAGAGPGVFPARQVSTLPDTNTVGCDEGRLLGGTRSTLARTGIGREVVADAHRVGELQPEGGQQGERGRTSDGREAVAVADSNGRRFGAGWPEAQAWKPHAARSGSALADPDRQGLAVGPRVFRNVGPELQAIKRSSSTGAGLWAAEPDVGRVAHGIPKRVDRLRGLGNAVVPLEGYLLGRLILAAD